ncbi:hypothetical protein B9Z55_006067 [Caenorhabditis nigoni]|uniref:GH18 domain-containing protein n=2 Tax=Caenorhabditis nigoni TaxID=1611254 RepID=A0A2G5V3I7_9PELO|nr:hypothetical protein B9Z55_006067 [Caenorhabditis nigoni]
MLPEPVPQKRIVGYYFGFESLDITKCQLEKLTHAVFGFLEITPEGNIIFPSAEAAMRYYDLKEKSKEVKNDLKLMISIGGPEYSENFSSLIVDPVKRKMLITNISKFIEKTGSDGIDISWKWPKQSEKSAYSSFFKELRNDMKLQQKQHLISVLVPPVDIGRWEAGFDFNEILKYVDFFNVFTMYYYGPWANQSGALVGPTAPLCKTCPEERKNFNIDHTLDYYIQKTGEPEKLNMVIPFFARLWKNVGDPVEPYQFGIRWAEMKDGKAEGNPYMSRWTMKNEGWDTWGMQWDNKTQTSFLHNPEKRTYLSLETKDSIEEKMNYADYKKLGGIWIWSVDMGDETNCLLKYVYSYNQKGKAQISKETLNSAPKTACSTIEKTSKAVLKSSPEKRVIGYYSENEYTEITTDQLQKLTHVVFAYIQMNSDGSLEFKNDHIKNRFFDLKNKSKSVSKTMVSFGAEESSSYFDMVLKQLEKSRGR